MANLAKLSVFAISISLLHISVLCLPTSNSAAITANPTDRHSGVSATAVSNPEAHVGVIRPSSSKGLFPSGSSTIAIGKPVSTFTNTPAMVTGYKPTEPSASKPPTVTTYKQPTSTTIAGASAGAQAGGSGKLTAVISSNGSKTGDAVAAAAAKTGNDLSKDSSAVINGLAAGVEDAAKGGAKAGAAVLQRPPLVQFGGISKSAGSSGNGYGFGFGTNGSGSRSEYEFSSFNSGGSLDRPAGRWSIEVPLRQFSFSPGQFPPNQVSFGQSFGSGVKGTGALPFGGFPTGLIQGQVGEN